METKPHVPLHKRSLSLSTSKSPQSESSTSSKSAKRQKIASSPSQDSDENGGNALGITFGEKDGGERELEIADSQDVEDMDVDDTTDDELDSEENISEKAKDKVTAKPIKKTAAARLPSSRIKSGGSSIPSKPKSGKNISLSALVSNKGSATNDVKRRLSSAGNFHFDLREFKSIVRWTRMHRTTKVTHHKAEFVELLSHMGFMDAELSTEEQNALKAKVGLKMRTTLNNAMRKAGAITDSHDGYESSGSSVFQPLAFAEWTHWWFKRGWDGSLTKPDKVKYEAVMNEPDSDDEAVTANTQQEKKQIEGKGRAKETAKENGKGKSKVREQDARVHSPVRRYSSAESEATVSADLQLEENISQYPFSHYKEDDNRPELFIVEEPFLEVSEPASPIPPPKNDFPDVTNWNTYLLNKEIIDEHDWNYRVMTAQSLGLDLKAVAALYPDPHPGYEAPPHEENDDFAGYATVAPDLGVPKPVFSKAVSG
ncbi:hypothetical protein WAI453_007135 [Rhynchosporium graminicola]